MSAALGGRGSLLGWLCLAVGLLLHLPESRGGQIGQEGTCNCVLGMAKLSSSLTRIQVILLLNPKHPSFLDFDASGGVEISWSTALGLCIIIVEIIPRACAAKSNRIFHCQSFVIVYYDLFKTSSSL